MFGFIPKLAGDAGCDIFNWRLIRVSSHPWTAAGEGGALAVRNIRTSPASCMWILSFRSNAVKQALEWITDPQTKQAILAMHVFIPILYENLGLIRTVPARKQVYHHKWLFKETETKL